MSNSAIQHIRDLAGLPRPIQEAKKDPEVLSENAGETTKQWYHEAPKVVKHQGKNYTLKKQATVKDGETVFFKYWAKKPKGEVIAPIVQFVVEYNRGSDLYDITIESYDINMNKTASRTVHRLGWENFSSFGFMRDVMMESVREGMDVADARLQDELKDYSGTRRVPDEPDQYDSFDSALADMRAQVFDGRRGTERRLHEKKDERIFRMFAFYKGPEMRKMGSVALPDGKDASKKAAKAGERIYDYDPHSRIGWEMHDQGTGKAFWVRTQVKHFLDSGKY